MIPLRTGVILLPYLVSFLLTVWIGRLAWQRRSVAGAMAFAALAGSEAVWTLGYVFQILSQQKAGMIFWNSVQFLGAVGAPLAFLTFALEYNRTLGRRLGRFFWGVALFLGIALLVFIWTDEWHHQFRGNITIVPGQLVSRLVFSQGWGFMLFQAYAYSLIVLATIFLLAQYFYATRIYQVQVGIVLVGILIPWITTMVTALGLVTVYLHDVTPLTFGLSNLIVAWALFRYHLFETVPVARDYVVENLPEGILVLDDNGRIIDLNPAGARILGLKKEVAIGREVRQFFPFHPDRIRLMKGSTDTVEVRLGNDSPDYLGLVGDYELQMTILRHSLGEAWIYLLVLRDIRDRKRIEDRLRQMAITDPLTGLYNRGHLLTLAQAAFEAALSNHQDLTLVMIDIDHFKSVNDAYGHLVGDTVLHEIAQCCLRNLRPSDLMGRYGGEEFLVVLPETNRGTAASVAERLRLEVAQLHPAEWDSSLQVTISLGTASLRDFASDSLDELLDLADQALYIAKKKGRNQVVTGRTEEMNSRDSS